jgi:alpha-glutamyl/putrescinyl thymine pyrophosphorylase clade 1
MTRLPDASLVFESYWRFAAERQAMYERRLRGDAGPWTDDPILQSFRFTNAFRAADRVSQFLIREVVYRGDASADEIVFRILLFKFFNKIDTWDFLVRELGPITIGTFDPCRAEALLTRARSHGTRIYSNAYIIPPLPGRASPKHAGHLQLALELADTGFAARVCSTDGLADLFALLRRIPGLGGFLAYQFAIDLGYSTVVDHDEDEFVVAGPGALDGLSKVFPGMDLRRAAEVIRQMTNEQEYWFDHFGLTFGGLFGRRLHLIDIQNLFCEISKYSRVAHPEVGGVAGRTRIKQVFRPSGAIAEPWFPPKWNLRCPVSQFQPSDHADPTARQLTLV